MTSAGARAYNGRLGAEPPAGSRVKARGQGVRGRSPLKPKSFLLLDVHWKRQICAYSPCIADSVNNLITAANWQFVVELFYVCLYFITGVRTLALH